MPAFAGNYRNSYKDAQLLHNPRGADLVSILRLESFAERHEHVLHAVWVITWAMIMTYLSLLFIFSTGISKDDQARQRFLDFSIEWVIVLFVVQLTLLTIMVPLIRWIVPKIGRYVLGRTLFNLESVLYFLFAIEMLPSFLASLAGIPILLTFLQAREGITDLLPIHEFWYEAWFYIFPLIILLSLGLIYWKGSWLLREGSGIDSRESIFLITLVSSLYFIGCFINILFVIVVSQFVEFFAL